MLYDIAFLIFSLFYLPTLIFKGKMHADFAERFGNYRPDKRKALEAARGGIWIQAVSVGEVAVCRTLIKGLKGLYSDKRIVLSTITKAGNALARKLYAKDAVIIYFPLDLSWIVRKALALIRPDLYIMVETEIWPNMIRRIGKTGGRCVIVNGRISDKSFGKYKMASVFLNNTVGPRRRKDKGDRRASGEGHRYREYEA
jgi:3-deoxy-D-manno-octulosonic-acid transferase